MSLGNFSERVHIIPIVAPIDTTSSTITTAEVDAGEAQWLEFLLDFGVITGDEVVVTVEKCTDTSGSGAAAIAFNYRLSAVAGTDTMGAITAATASGVTITADDDGKILLIEVNPADLASGGPYARVVIDPGGSASVALVAVLALV